MLRLIELQSIILRIILVHEFTLWKKNQNILRNVNYSICDNNLKDVVFKPHSLLNPFHQEYLKTFKFLKNIAKNIRKNLSACHANYKQNVCRSVCSRNMLFKCMKIYWTCIIYGIFFFCHSFSNFFIKQFCTSAMIYLALCCLVFNF